MPTQHVEKQVERLAAPIIEEFGLELVDIEYTQQGRHWLLCLYIDKPGGVTLDDCANFSREFSTALDVEDVVPGAYRLEVSSPGLDRPLKKMADFTRFAGEMIKLKTTTLSDPDARGYTRKTFVGILLGLDGECVELEQVDSAGGKVLIPLQEIDKANLEPQF
ncbi:MAG: ribosome maturation factor RimP [Desulfuromonadaceae bacterium]|nr:ribosome maturation factor RimP [Desulfuromonadaceae bacterium]